MEDLKKLDDEIVRCAEAAVAAYGQHGPWEQQHIQALKDAVAAKRSASRPKLLSAEEARPVFLSEYEAARQTTYSPTSLALAGHKAVLDACLSRAIDVIEGLPRRVIDGSVRPEDGDCRSMADIRSALSTRSS